MSFSVISAPAANASNAEFCLSELEQRLEMTALGDVATAAYVCCQCTLYGCDNEAQ